jgi:dCTP deaminase
MGILTHEEIKKLISQEQLKIDPLYPDAVRENGLDLRIGGEYAVYVREGVVVRPCELEDARHLFRIVKAEEVVIPPRNFVLLTTEEHVEMPEDVVGLANLRSTLARHGLVIPHTVVDADFEDNITIEVDNKSPNTIVLKREMQILHLVLIRAEGRATYTGKYHMQLPRRRG